MSTLWQTGALWVLVFFLNLAETVIVILERRYDRLASRPGGKKKHSLISAGWAGLFEVVLLIDMILIVGEDRWLVIPCTIGAFVGTYYTLESRRKKLNAMRFKKGERKRAKEAKERGSKNESLPTR